MESKEPKTTDAEDTTTTILFTSESVNDGHPGLALLFFFVPTSYCPHASSIDKICDQISDAILDACLAADPNSKVACGTVLLVVRFSLSLIVVL